VKADKLYLVGFMAAGKTTVARALARRLDWQAVDIDELIEQREHLTVAEIFAKRGEAYFRALEREILIDQTAWYPLENWLAAFSAIAESLGPRALFQIGQTAPSFVVLPPTLNDIHSGVAGVNVGYHMNHRKDGVPMFDPATGHMLTGIGDYGYAPVPGERRIISRCDTPYPCDFDRGIVLGFATKFEKGARIEHDDSAPCRKNGHPSCTYLISW